MGALDDTKRGSAACMFGSGREVHQGPRLDVSTPFDHLITAVSQIPDPASLHSQIVAQPDGSPQRVSYIAATAIDRPQPGIKRVVVVVHGIDRDGLRYWRALSRAARRAGPESEAEAYLVALQFLARRDVRSGGLASDLLTWRGPAWKAGDPSYGVGLSSFEALDQLIAHLADRSRFPHLEKVVLVGHSAGAQFVQRYAAASPSDGGLRLAGIAMRFVVANPSSYLYLDGSRPGFGKAGGFAPPPAGVVANCPDYNHYKYGLERPNPYVARIGADRIREQYRDREVIYLLGAEDNDSGGETLDASCAAMMQGKTRLDRGRAFAEHLARVYGEEVRRRHILEIVPRLGHQGARILRSRIGLRWLFDLEASLGGR
jgi:pimeloyl-ACP methyl ester carboxylesterase